MNLNKIVESEKTNHGDINLYLEGMFWKAYQQSAFLFATNVCSYKVVKKKVKLVNADVASLGFPKSSLEKLFKEYQIETVTDKHIKIAGYSFDQDTYLHWFESIKAGNSNKNESKQSATPVLVIKDNEMAVLTQLRDFRIDRATPLDCMQFILSSQKLLDGNI